MPRARSVALLAALLGCATPAEPQIVIQNPAPIPGPLYLVAAKEKREILASLARAGVDLTDDLTAATAVLRVTLGVEKNRKSCGAYSNVRYAVRRDRERLGIGKRSCVLGTSDKYDSVKFEPIRKSDPRWGPPGPTRAIRSRIGAEQAARVAVVVANGIGGSPPG